MEKKRKKPSEKQHKELTPEELKMIEEDIKKFFLKFLSHPPPMGGGGMSSSSLGPLPEAWEFEGSAQYLSCS